MLSGKMPFCQEKNSFLVCLANVQEIPGSFLGHA
jgi:hypothetical protein